jgi:ribosomal protein S18 acetylase RimI-like enzyme
MRIRPRAVADCAALARDKYAAAFAPGMAQACLGGVLAAAPAQPVPRDVRARNAAALHLYRSRGFTVVASRPPVFVGGSAPDSDLVNLRAGAS